MHNSNVIFMGGDGTLGTPSHLPGGINILINMGLKPWMDKYGWEMGAVVNLVE